MLLMVMLFKIHVKRFPYFQLLIFNGVIIICQKKYHNFLMKDVGGVQTSSSVAMRKDFVP